MRRVEGNVRSRRVFFFFSFSKIDDERFQARFQARLHDNRISPPFFFVRKFGTRNLEPVVFGGKTFPSDRNLNSRRGRVIEYK